MPKKEYADARALGAPASRVFVFLVRFLDEVLLPDPDRDEKSSAGADLVHIRSGLEQILRAARSGR